MNAPQRFVLRAHYVEQGRLAMLSHLEVARTLERTIRRAGLPFAVSQGFSPHMKIAFGAALPVGVGSTCETFDVQLTRYVPADEALCALQRASVPDLMVTSCAYLDPGAKAASVAFPLSTYEVRLSHAVPRLTAPAQVKVVRKRKERVLEVADFLVGDVRPVDRRSDGGHEVWRFTLRAREQGSLRPDVLLAAMLDQACADGEGAAGELQVVSTTRVAQAAAE
ncbi:DUF2344 domain-containing protein [Eggerthellaceae bacterium zg-1084]|uniref:TIGR03936 family radical SAM-associated protein n=1 Tax=Berryella wangjianweii TaxID=2734634 RepID=UPI0015529AF1|nr:TIGR03936 family radical SAM-associated protein [Berryella wangjianweii]NPD30619.1 DUF2344 domain-containing protein [Berryella wangjianweii]